MKSMIVEMKKGKFAGTLAEVLSVTTNKKGIPVYKVRRLDTNRKGTWQVSKCALNEKESIQAIAQAITTPDIARIFQAGIEAYYKSNNMNWILNLDEVGQPIKAYIAEINDIRNEIIAACSSAKEIMDFHKTKQDSLMQIVHSNWKIEELEKAIGIETPAEIIQSDVKAGTVYKMDFKDTDATPTVRVIKIENGIVSFTKIGGVFPLCKMEVAEFRQAIVEKLDFGTELEIPSEIIQTVESEPIQLEIEVAKPFIFKTYMEEADEPSLDNIVSEQVREQVATLNNQLTAEDFKKVKTALSECGYQPMPITAMEASRAGLHGNYSHLGFILPGSKVEREPEQSLEKSINAAVDFIVDDCIIGKGIKFIADDDNVFQLFENRSFFEDGETEYNGDYVIVFDDIEWIEETETTETTEEAA